MQRGPIEQLKVAVIGDGTVGKTSLLYSFSSNVFPGEYLPTYDTDHFAAIVTFHGAHYRLLLWDSPGQDELFGPVRHILLHQVDIILICYAIDSAASLHNARYRWIPELKQIIPDTPMIIVGTKSDLRPPRNHLGPTMSSGSYTPIRLSGRLQTTVEKSPSKPSSHLAVPGKKQAQRSPKKSPLVSPSESPLPSPPTSLSPVSPRHNRSSSNSLIICPDNTDSLDSPMSSDLPPSPSKTPPSGPTVKIVEYTDGLQLARDVGSSAYVECSALTRAGMDGVFQEVCAAYCLKHDKLHKSGTGRQSSRWKGRNLAYRMSFRKPH